MTYVIEDCPWRQPDAREQFLEVISATSRSALVDLWRNNPAWQEEIGNVLLTCLKVLHESGTRRSKRGTHDTDEFRVIWQPFSEAPVYKVTLKAEDHPWVKFLKDTDSSSAMAVLVEDSLRPP